MDSTVYERFKQIRKRYGFSQEQFAKELGISRTHISNIENGNDNPSSSLLKLLCTKFNIEEQWIVEGIGAQTPSYNTHTDEGAFSKYNEMRVIFEQQLRASSGEDLCSMVESFSYLTALLTPRRLNAHESSDYLKAIRSSIDLMEKLTFMVSVDRSLLPSKKDAGGWLAFKSSCEERIKAIEENLKTAANFYLARYGEEMKL